MQSRVSDIYDTFSENLKHNVSLLSQVLDSREGPITKFCVASTLIDIMANSELMRLARANPMEVPTHLQQICLKYPVATNQTLSNSLGIKVTQTGKILHVEKKTGGIIAKVDEDEIGSGQDLINTALVRFCRDSGAGEAAHMISAVDITARAARINALTPYPVGTGQHYDYYCQHVDGNSSLMPERPPEHDIEDEEGELNEDLVDEAPDLFTPPDGKIKVKDMKLMAEAALNSNKKIYFNKAKHVFVSTDPLVQDAAAKGIPYVLIKNSEDDQDAEGIIMGDIQGGIAPLAPGPESEKAYGELLEALSDADLTFELDEKPAAKDRAHQAPPRSAYMAEENLVAVPLETLENSYKEMYHDTIDILRVDNERRPDPATLNQKHEKAGWGPHRKVLDGKNGTIWVGNPLLNARNDLPRSLKNSVADLKKKTVTHQYTLRQAIAKIAEFIEALTSQQNYVAKQGAEIDPISLAMNTMAKNYNGWTIEERQEDGEYVFVADSATRGIPRATAARGWHPRI